ncbi:MAG TPA: PAS domain S-box protein [Methanospirillum sp.]|nr:PAS domain S-box protein [Methanospirillum sp.]
MPGRQPKPIKPITHHQVSSDNKGGNDHQIRDKTEDKTARTPVHSLKAGETLVDLIHELRVHQIEIELQNEELKNAYILLEESRDRYQKLYDLAPVGYFTLTEKALISEVNQTGASMIGVERHRLKRSRFRRFISPDQHDRWDHFFLDLLHNGRGTLDEIKAIRKDGSIIIVRIVGGILENAENASSIHLVVSDISELHKRSEQVKILAELTDDAPASITIHDFEGKFLYINQRTLDLHGFNREEFLGKTLHEIDVPGSEQLIVPRMNQLKKTCEVSFNVEHFRKDGSTLPLHVSCKRRMWEGKPVILSIATEYPGQRERGEGLRSSKASYDQISRMVHQGIRDHLSSFIPPVMVEKNRIHGRKNDSLSDKMNNRIRFMSLAHDILSRIDTPDKVDLDTYLNALAPHMISTSEENIGIILTVHAPGVEMNSGAAAMCGVIIYDLVTLAIQCAFPDSEKNGCDSDTITVEVALKDTEYIISVQDNGVSLSSKGGRKLVRTRALSRVGQVIDEHFGGSLEYSTLEDRGTVCIVRFKRV